MNNFFKGLWVGFAHLIPMVKTSDFRLIIFNIYTINLKIQIIKTTNISHMVNTTLNIIPFVLFQPTFCCTQLQKNTYFVFNIVYPVFILCTIAIFINALAVSCMTSTPEYISIRVVIIYLT